MGTTLSSLTGSLVLALVYTPAKGGDVGDAVILVLHQLEEYHECSVSLTVVTCRVSGWELEVRNK